MSELLTRKQAMERMHIGHTKMNRYLKDPDFPAIKDGIWYVFGDRIEEYLMNLKKKEAISEARQYLRLVK